MLSRQLLKKLTLTIFATVSTYGISNIASAQSPFFYYPSASFFSPTASYYQSEDLGDLATIIQSGRFTTFNTNLQTAKLSEILSKKETLTVLAPTEEAFAALSPELQEKLSQPEILDRVLRYHMIEGIISDNDIKRREVATLLEQNSVKIGGVSGDNNQITVKLNDATASDPLLADNGVVIPIDKVLIPPSL
ncbi:fasciclin domain-containing protein [Waterburya agarophytonicola K14]|uniref:Fasciclin domain-containing protein n=1 Tax=Waterburya agarophytonicola KI4 TaxID=2874699 RepID=A0A964BLQ0_9CYAN|nr:fasciclin domain-containing protein [Waterburya agarophytonicola]MCC0175699.1 fasciclin domain-containing protein [Waterburya agarophytonicola KI4]